MSHTGELTIGIPVLNEASTVTDTVECALSESMGRVIVVDNGSTDDTPVRLSVFANHPRVRLVSLPRNMGPGRSFRLCLDLAKTRLFSWLGAHDRVERGYYNYLCEALQTDQELGFAFGRYAHAGSSPRHAYDFCSSLDPRTRVLGILRKPQDGAMIHGVFQADALRLAYATDRAFEPLDGSLLARVLIDKRGRYLSSAAYVNGRIRQGQSSLAQSSRVRKTLMEGEVNYPRYWDPVTEMKASMLSTGEDVDQDLGIALNIRYGRLANARWSPLAWSATRRVAKRVGRGRAS